MAEDVSETDYLRSRGYMPPAEIESQRSSNTQKLEDISNREIDVIKGVRDERMKLAGTPTPRPGLPRLQELPGSPQVPQTDPFQVFQNPAVLLATLGSMFTRAPLTSAMNAGAAAMEAQRKGDIQTFELEQKKWHDETERAKEHNANELTKYNALWQNAKMSMEEKLAKMNALAAGEKDEVLIAGIQSGQVDRIDKVLDARQRANEQLELSLTRSREARETREANKPADRRALDKFMEEHPDATSEDIQKFVRNTRVQSMNASNVALQKYLEQNPNATPQEIQTFVQSGKPAGRSAIAMYLNKYMQEHPEATSEDIKTATQKFSTQQVAQNRFLSGPQGNTIRSLNVVVSHLDTLKELGDALKNGNLPRFNQLAQRWAQETGQAAPTNFTAAKQIIGTEVIKALGVAGAGTKEERQDAAEAFSRASSPAQLDGAIQTVQKLLTGQLRGLRRQFTSSTGLQADAFNEMLEPHTRDILDPQETQKDEGWGELKVH